MLSTLYGTALLGGGVIIAALTVSAAIGLLFNGLFSIKLPFALLFWVKFIVNKGFGSLFLFLLYAATISLIALSKEVAFPSQEVLVTEK